jgi:hypothetical protein
MAEFVDNLLKISAHAMCRGIARECPVCLVALVIAQEEMAFLDKMLKKCGLHYSEKGDLTNRQDHLHIGIIFDALRGRLLISQENFDKTMTLRQAVMEQAEISPRGITKLRCKFGHQFRCIKGVAPFLVPSNKFIGCQKARVSGTRTGKYHISCARRWTSSSGGCRDYNSSEWKCGHLIWLPSCFAGKMACHCQGDRWSLSIGIRLRSHSAFPFGHCQTRSGEPQACIMSRQLQL